MGNISSILCEEELEELKNTSVFSYIEIEYLFERFCYLDKMNLGYLTYNELNNIPEFMMNPFNKLICNVIEKRLDYENISFPHFLEFLGIFSEKSDKSKRIKFLFEVFDLNGDGRLCRSVLKRIFSQMGGEDNNEIEYVLKEYDKGRKGYLDYKDFTYFYESDPSLDKIMLIDFTKNIKKPTRITISDIVIPYLFDKKQT